MLEKWSISSLPSTLIISFFESGQMSRFGEASAPWHTGLSGPIPQSVEGGLSGGFDELGSNSSSSIPSRSPERANKSGSISNKNRSPDHVGVHISQIAIPTRVHRPHLSNLPISQVAISTRVHRPDLPLTKTRLEWLRVGRSHRFQR